MRASIEPYTRTSRDVKVFLFTSVWLHTKGAGDQSCRSCVYTPLMALINTQVTSAHAHRCGESPRRPSDAHAHPLGSLDQLLPKSRTPPQIGVTAACAWGTPMHSHDQLAKRRAQKEPRSSQIHEKSEGASAQKALDAPQCAR